MAPQRVLTAHSEIKQIHHDRPIFVDECCRVFFDYLRDRKMAVYKLKNGLSDEEIKTVSSALGAYIVTSDTGFDDYENALYVRSDIKPRTVYRMLKTLIDCERNFMENCQNMYECNVSGMNHKTQMMPHPTQAVFSEKHINLLKSKSRVL